MKIILNSGQYSFNPSLNRVTFDAMGGAFKPERLLAIINTTTGKVVFTTGGTNAGLSGTFTNGTFTNSILTYTSSNAGQSASDILEIFYDDENFIQPVSGTVSVTQPVQVEGLTGTGSAVASAIYDGSGTFPILSSIDPISSRDGLDINLLSSSYGGKLNNPLPAPYGDQAISVGFNNGGNLSSPAMDLATNQLIVDATQSGNVPVDIMSSTGAINVFIADVTTSNPINVRTPDVFVTGFGPQTTINNNLLELTSTASSTDTSGFKSAVVQLVSNSTTGAFIFEHSNDNINFTPMTVYRGDSASPAPIVAAVTPTVSSFVYHFPIKARYIRCRISTVLNSTGIRAFTRYSQESWSPIVNTTVQSVAANLNATISGNIGTVTTVTGVTTVSTVSAVQAANLGIPAIVSDVGSAAITTTTTTGTLTPTAGPAYQVVIPVTVVSGTNPTLDISIEESDDTGTNWVRVYDFPRITAIGVYRSGPIKLRGNRIRYVQTVGGTGPSFTRSIGRLQRSDTIFSRLGIIDRVINPNTLNSTSAILYCDGTSEFNYYIRCTAQTTAATVQIQFSDDASNWYSPASATLTTVNGFVKGQISDEYWRFARAIVTSAGTGITLGEFSLKAARE